MLPRATNADDHNGLVSNGPASRGRHRQRYIRGSIGGASGDAGVEYRRAVAAYAITYGLAGLPLPGFGAPMAEAYVSAVVIETSDAVDDVRIEFTLGWRALVQAKRRLRKGTQFDAALAQWVRAAQEGVDPDRDRLVIVTADLSGPLRGVKDLLDRFKSDVVEDLTASEDMSLAFLNERLASLGSTERERVLRAAMIHELDVEEPDARDAREGLLLLEKVVNDDSRRAWIELVGAAGHAARRRSGYTIAGWLDQLRGRGVRIAAGGDTPAARLERSHRAVRGYVEVLKQRAATIDLRGLGASIPPLDIADADCSLSVTLERDDRTATADLLWTFLRRGRMILTGLPGSGKSTSLSVLAARVGDAVDDYVPILASLKDVDALDRSASFEDRVLTVAVRDLAESDRPLVRAALAERVRSGGTALLFDGLDETYERRGAVVSELAEFVSRISPAVEILVSTRDVAYAQAATLGWREARLAPPEHLDRTVGAILRVAEAARPAADRNDQPGQRWIAARRRWVNAALAADRTLVETPLMPVLLTLLATERADGNLPSGRANILSAVVADAVGRREAHRRAEFTVGQLAGRSAAEAAMDAFSEEATMILDHRGECSLADATGAVENMMRHRWGLAPGPARVAASDAVHFWDETGIFVLAGATETVSPRLMLFAEIGDAMRAVGLEEPALRGWTVRRAAAGSVEALVLAAGLSPAACREATDVAVSAANDDLLRGLVGALREGATLDAPACAALISALLDDAVRGDRAGWRSWGAVLSMAPEGVDPQGLRRPLEVYPDPYRVVGDALLALTYRAKEDLRRRPASLIAALRVEHLPSLARRRPQPGVDFSDLAVDHRLIDAVSGAAEVLLGYDPRATDLVLEHAAQGPQVLQDRLERLLRTRGFGDEVDAALAEQRTKLAASVSRMLKNYDRDAPWKLLAELAARPQSPLTRVQRMRLDELADLVETLNLNDSSSWVGNARASRYGDVVELSAVLGGLELGVIAAQAQVVLDRIGRSDDSAPFFALFDGAQNRELEHWDAVADRDAAVDLLLDMLTWGLGNARVAVAALWGTPVADLAAERVRSMLPRLAVSTEHERLAAHLLLSMVDGPEPHSWLESDDPILRAVAADRCDATSGDGLSPQLLRLLADPDGHVRCAAVRRAENVSGRNRDAALERVARGPDPGWTCLSCRTLNDAGRSACAKADCHRAAPNPAQEARQVLDQPRSESN